MMLYLLCVGECIGPSGKAHSVKCKTEFYSAKYVAILLFKKASSNNPLNRFEKKEGHLSLSMVVHPTSSQKNVNIQQITGSTVLPCPVKSLDENIKEFIWLFMKNKMNNCSRDDNERTCC